MPLTWPALQERSQAARVNLYDGQTLMLGLSQAQAKQISYAEPDEWREGLVAKHILRAKKGGTMVLVFITPTITTDTGSRAHSDGDMLFAEDRVPVQPAGDHN